MLIGILTLISLLLIVWEISIYRKTFINFLIPLSLLIGGGFLVFLLVKNRIQYYISSESSFYAKAFHGTIMFGGMIMFSFMAFNYYLPSSSENEVTLKVLKTGYLAASRRGCSHPFAIVEYEKTEKQLVFPCHVIIRNSDSIELQLDRGLFGFLIVEERHLLSFRSEDLIRNDNIEIEKQYDKIKLKAEEYYSEGNIKKAVELYERALQLKPSDKQAAFRLKELKMQ